MSFETVLAEAQSQRKLRVWSLIITLFGDAIVPRGGAVSAQTIQMVLQHFHIAPGAVRTAFSRLTNDGWVIRERHGRNSFYRLSDTGYEPFASASERIYAAPLPSPEDNQLVVAIAPNVLIEGKTLSTDFGLSRLQFFNPDDPQIAKRQSEGCLILEAEPRSIPEWVYNEILPQDIVRGFVELTRQFKNVQVHTPIDALALRTLLIHEWRRLLLRIPIVPNGFLPDNSPLRLCQRQIMTTYENCMELSENWLNENGEGPDGPLPAPVKLHRRFQTK